MLHYGWMVAPGFYPIFHIEGNTIFMDETNLIPFNTTDLTQPIQWELMEDGQTYITFLGENLIFTVERLYYSTWVGCLYMVDENNPETELMLIYKTPEMGMPQSAAKMIIRYAIKRGFLIMDQLSTSLPDYRTVNDFSIGGGFTI